MSELLVSPSPHIQSKRNTTALMNDVLIALLPATVVSMLFYGWNFFFLMVAAIASCVLCEMLILKCCFHRRECCISAAVTGVLLALNLPPAAPWWIAVVGGIVAIGVAKMTFGGLGQNIFNPALVGRVFLLVSFPVIMTTWNSPAGWLSGVDAFSGATPLGVINAGLAQGHSAADIVAQNGYTSFSALFARMGGSAGEVSALALIAGFIYLLVRRVIRPHITVSILATVAVMTAIFSAINPATFTGPAFNLLTGGLLLGSIFMATDYVTSPMTGKGMIIYGVLIGVLTVLIRYFGSYPEGVSFAILIANITVPLINKYCKPKRFAKEAK